MCSGLAALVGCVVLAACAAGTKRAAAPPTVEAAPSTSGAQSPLPGSPHDEIEQLDQKIEMSRAELKLPELTEQDWQGTKPEPMGSQPALQDPKCRPAPNDTCKTSCTLSDSICDNANRICELAKSLPGDNWALNKCAKANTTCEASRTKCCGCQ
jgi:hypothetical protein